MSERVSAANILIDSLLPEALRDERRVYDKKGMDGLMTAIAQNHPELYSGIAQKLADIGRHQAYFRGETFTLDDFKPVHDRQPEFDQLDQKEAEIRQRVTDPDERRAELSSLYGDTSARISRETNTQALGRRNNIALTVLTGARGKEAQLRDLISTPGFYSDGKGRPIPWYIRHSFAEGMRPADFLAGTYAARESVTGSKKATAQGGFMAKTLSRAAATHIITADDCGTANGIDLPIDEPDIRGRVLQRPEAGLPAGTVLDRTNLARLKAAKVKEVIVRSPITCGAEHGMCSKCFGVKAEGRFPKLGEHVGITAANAYGEPLTQAALCMYSDTWVRMADGSMRMIKDILPGEYVLGSDMWGNTKPTLVVNVFHNGVRDCYITFFSDGEEDQEIISTAEHKVLTTDEHNVTWIDEIAEARYLILQDGRRGTIVEVDHVGELDTWDIEVDNPDHLFVLANGAIVSNSMKHVTSGKGAKKEFSGLDYINQFMESPEEFKDRATVATAPGTLESITPAPQGGSYAVVGGERHYIPLEREITAAVGDQLEAGDSLTDGLIDVEDILTHKGLGAARRYWSDRMAEMGKASAAGMDRRLFEVLARAAVDHVQLDDPTEEGFLPDDVTRYSSYLHKRQLPDKVQTFAPREAVGQWLEQPALHHTIGTKITPKVAEYLESKGVDRIFASNVEPTFRPQFVRLQQVASTSDDWLASLGGSYLGNQLQQGITRAQDTNIESNIHPVPRLAVGVGYAEDIERTGKF